MSIDRRDFFKVLGVTGVTLATGKRLGAEPAPDMDSRQEFFGMLYDSTRCAGCQGCEFACAEANGLPTPDLQDLPVVGTESKANETRRTVINVYNTSKGEMYVKRQCMHCNDPACAAACLTKAMYKTTDGSVIWRGDKCMGCRYCMVSCPFDVPKFEYFSANPKIEKCDMCYERLKEGKITGMRRETVLRRLLSSAPGGNYWRRPARGYTITLVRTMTKSTANMKPEEPDTSIFPPSHLRNWTSKRHCRNHPIPH